MTAHPDLHLLASETGTPTAEQYEEWYALHGDEGVFWDLPMPARHPWVVWRCLPLRINGYLQCGICDERVENPGATFHPDVFHFDEAHVGCAKAGTTFFTDNNHYEVTRPDGHYTVRCCNCREAFTTKDADDVQLPTHHKRCHWGVRSGRLTKRAVVASASASADARSTG